MFHPHYTRVLRVYLALSLLLILLVRPEVLHAASTLLVNTESFQTIDEGNSTTDVELRFGATLNEKIYWDRMNAEFRFTDDVRVEGNITGSGTLTVGGAAVLKSTLRLNNVTYTFPGGDGSASGKVLKTNAAGQLSWSTDLNTTNGITQTDADARYMNQSGDTMTGALKVRANLSGSTLNVDGNAGVYGALTSSGNIATKADLTINADNGAADAALTFGNATTAQTLKFLNTPQKFSFSKDVRVIGNLSGSSLNVDGTAGIYGALTVSGATTLKSTLKINNVMYAFPGSDGSASGRVLKTNGAGQLSWASLRYSGSTLSFHPDYKSAVYFASGASVGTLSLRYSSGSEVANHYRWQSTRTSNQQYWIQSRIQVPNNFATWETGNPLQLRYRSSGGYLNVFVRDTAGSNVALTNGSNLRNQSWTTATITGPQSAGTWTKNGYMTILLQLVSSGASVADRAYADVGFLNLNFDESLP